MKVIHIAKTPTAGSPIRIVNALNAHTDGLQLLDGRAAAVLAIAIVLVRWLVARG